MNAWNGEIEPWARKHQDPEIRYAAVRAYEYQCISSLNEILIRYDQETDSTARALLKLQIE